MGKLNGEVSLVTQVAAELTALSVELEENAEQAQTHASQMRGLAKVITRQNVVFIAEHAEQVARVIQESGDASTTAAAPSKYIRAKTLIRRVAAK